MIKIKASKKYDIHYDAETRCFKLLEFSRNLPRNQGYPLATVPKEALIDLIVEYWEEC